MISRAQVSESQDYGTVELADHERPDAERIPDADELLHGQDAERIGAFDPLEGIDEASHEAMLTLVASGDQMNDDLGV